MITRQRAAQTASDVPRGTLVRVVVVVLVAAAEERGGAVVLLKRSVVYHELVVDRKGRLWRGAVVSRGR